MPLDASVRRFIGRRVPVVTVPGHGWIDKDSNAVAPLPEFFVTIARFWSFCGERREGIGQVLHPGHPADELWLVFSVRSQSLHDFDTNPCAYNQPHLDEPGTTRSCRHGLAVGARLLHDLDVGGVRQPPRRPLSSQRDCFSCSTNAANA